MDKPSGAFGQSVEPAAQEEPPVRLGQRVLFFSIVIDALVILLALGVYFVIPREALKPEPKRDLLDPSEMLADISEMPYLSEEERAQLEQMQGMMAGLQGLQQGSPGEVLPETSADPEAPPTPRPMEPTSWRYDDVVGIPTPSETVTGVVKLGSSTVELKDVYAKVSRNQRSVEVGLFSEPLTPEQRENYSKKKSLKGAKDPEPALLLMLEFSPFGDQCDLVSLTSYAVRISGAATGDSAPVLVMRSMARGNEDEFQNLECTRAKGKEITIEMRGFETMKDGSELEWDFNTLARLT